MRTILILLCTLSFLTASPQDSLFKAANSLYDEQRYDSASTLYSEAITAGSESSVLYYNLSNSSYRMGRIGEAILYNEKALRLAPDDEDIISNLKYLRTQIVDELPEVSSNPISDTVLFLHNLFSLQVEIWIVIALSFIFLIFASIVLFRGGARRIWGIYGGGMVLLLILLFGGSAFAKVHRIENVKSGIILTENVEARSEPGGGQLIFTAHEGTKLQILSTHGNWLFVSLPNGTAGYVREQSIGKI